MESMPQAESELLNEVAMKPAHLPLADSIASMTMQSDDEKTPVDASSVPYTEAIADQHSMVQPFSFFSRTNTSKDNRMEGEEQLSPGDDSSVPETEASVQDRVDPIISKKYSYTDGPMVINVQNMFGNVIHVNKIICKKEKVIDPDLLAYDSEIAGGNCLLNAVCYDMDIRLKWKEVCQTFDIHIPEEDLVEPYDYLYQKLSKHIIDNRVTRYQFLKKIGEVCDISHLCKVSADQPI